MVQWLSTNWQPILVGLLALETALSRIFPNVGFLQTAQKDTQAVATATGVKAQ